MDVARITPNNDLVMNGDCNGHIVLVPSIHLSFFQLPLPATSIAQCQRIIAFSLEEELAQDINELHYAVQKSGDEWFVVVCSHEKMQAWLTLCHEHNLHPKKLIPDVLVLPKESQFLIEPDQCLLHLPEQLPVAIHPNIIEQIIELLSAEEIPTPFVAESYEELLESEIHIENHTINLLQNEYSKSTSYATILRPWIKVALWGGILWTSLSAFLFFENQQIQANITEIKQNNIAQFKQLFPEETRIVNLRTQAEQKFRRITEQKKIYSINFIGLTEHVIPALEQYNNISVSQIDYNRYALKIYVDSNSVATIQNFINKLKENTVLEIDVQSLGEDGGKAKSTINIAKQI